MTAYLSIEPLQEPFDLGLDDSGGRVLCVFNVLARKRPSANFAQELVSILVGAGVGVANETIFGSSLDLIPEGPGPYLHVKVMPGTSPDGTHNDGAGAYRRPSAQILVHARSWPAAEAMAQAAYAALVALRNQEVVA